MKNTKCILLLLLLFTMGNMLAQSQQPRTIEEKLQYFLQIADAVRVQANIPGVGISIVYDNEILYTGGLGVRDRTKNLPVTENTVFSIGSNTKAFTGLLSTKLVTRKMLDWNTPLKSYIPELELKEPYVTDHVTMADALRHRTGLGRQDNVWKYKNLSRGQLLKSLKTLDFAHGFRETYDYNNFMYVVAGIAQERITGKSWETLIREEIFSPLKMKNSYTTDQEFWQAKERALGYQKDGSTLATPVHLSGIAPSGAISSTPKDMAKWLQMLVDGGRFDGKEYLTPEEYNYMLTPHEDISIRNGNELWFYYTGLGGFSKNGKRNVGAEGSIDGQNSRLSMLLDDGFGIFIMTNQVSDYKRLLTTYAENIFVKNDYNRNWEWEKILAGSPDFKKFKHYLLEAGIDKARGFHQSLPEKHFETQMNYLGYELLRDNKLDKALFVFTLNTLDNPKSSNAFDSLGEAYFMAKDYPKAIQNYQKSLDLDATNNNAKMMLQKIRKQDKKEH
ncbi:serine hydrolase [Spongiimicrobium salis]|uniref:serine hydrolase n=1 Tax=Spongiimicrobium salis TaxID=1667022 RepID=UPI00374D438E